MNLLLDTHAFLWFFLNDPRMSETQRQILRREDNELFLSAVSVFEMSTKARIGKLPRSIEINALLDTIHEDYAFTEIVVRAPHAALAGRMDGVHRDPFDRLLAAQSIIEEMPLMTSDAVFKIFGVQTIW